MQGDAPRKRSIIDALIDTDRQGLEDVIGDIEFLIGMGSFVQAAKRFGELVRSLERIRKAEDRVLVPLVVNVTGDPEHLSAALEDEHQSLARQLEWLRASLATGDRAGVKKHAEAVRQTLRQHQRHQDSLLCPTLEAMGDVESELYRACHDAQVRSPSQDMSLVSASSVARPCRTNGFWGSVT